MNSFSACTFARAFSAMSSLVKVLAITMECSSADVLPGVWNKILRLELFIRAIYSTRFLSFILKNKSQLQLSFFYQICQTYKNTNGFSNQLVDDREVKEFFFYKQNFINDRRLSKIIFWNICRYRMWFNQKKFCLKLQSRLRTPNIRTKFELFIIPLHGICYEKLHCSQENLIRNKFNVFKLLP